MNAFKRKKSVFLIVSIYTLAVLLILVVSFPKSVSACGEPGGTPCAPAGADNTGNKVPAGADNTKTATPANGVKVSTGITNPLGNGITDLPTFIETILKYVLIIGVPIIVLAIIYAGFQFVIAQGNAEALKKAKMTLLYTLIGAALLLGSFLIANAIKSTVTEISNSQ